MKIHYSKLFLKHYKKRILPHPSLRKRFQVRLKLFEKDTKNLVLGDHALKGEKQSFRSFSITGDIRVIYHKEDSNSVIFIDVGTHPQVYGM